MNTSSVERAQSGDAAAFESLVGEHYRRVMAVAIAQGLTWHEAEDATQEAFLAAWTHLDSLKSPEAFPMWIARIARNIALNAHRSSDYRRKLAEHLRSENEGPRDTPLQKQESQESISVLLEKLRPSLRETISLFYLGELSVREIAATLEITENAVKKRLQLGRAQLKQLATDTLETDMRSLIGDEEVGYARARFGALAPLGVAVPDIAESAAGQASAVATATTSATGLSMGIGAVVALLVIASSGAWLVVNSMGDGPENNVPTRVPPTVVSQQIEGEEYAPQSAVPEIPAKLESEPQEARHEVEVVEADVEKDNAPIGPARLFGRVIDEAGNPIAGAEVAVYVSGNTSSASLKRHRQQYGDALARGITPQTRITDATGAYNFIDIRPHGYVYVLARADGYAMSARATISVAPDGEAELDITMRPGVPIRLRVFAPDGIPLALAYVQTVAQAVNGTHMYGENDSPGGWTDPQGFVELVVRENSVSSVIVFSSDHGIDTFSGIPAGQEDPIELRMSPASTLTGRVTDATGTPINGMVNLHSTALFRNESPDGGTMAMTMGGIDDLTQRIDDDGNYRFEGLSPNIEYTFEVVSGYGNAMSQTVPIPQLHSGQSTTFDYTIYEKILVTGRVVDPESGAPVPNIRVAWRSASRPHIKERHHVDEQGRFSFEVLAGDGEYIFTPRYLVETHTPQNVEKRIWLSSDKEHEITLEIPLGVQQEIRVVDTYGNPISDCRVQYRERVRSGFVHGNTDSDGFYSFGGFVPGVEAGFTVFHAGLYISTPLRAGRSGERLPLMEVPVYPTASATARIVDEHGEPIPQLNVSPTFEYEGFATRPESFQSDENGYLYMPNAVPATDFSMELRVYRQGNDLRGRLESGSAAPETTVDLGEITLIEDSPDRAPEL